MSKSQYSTVLRVIRIPTGWFLHSRVNLCVHPLFEPSLHQGQTFLMARLTRLADGIHLIVPEGHMRRTSVRRREEECVVEVLWTPEGSLLTGPCVQLVL